MSETSLDNIPQKYPDKYPKPEGYDVPTEGLEVNGKLVCGAWSRNAGRPCQKPAGSGTEHKGFGRCSRHGGKTPVIHGAYSKVLKGGLKKTMRKYEADENPLDVTRELAVVRTILDRWITNNAGILMTMEPVLDHSGKVLQDPRDILNTAIRLTDNVSKQVARIERIRSLTALSLEELQALIRKLAAVVERVIQDPDKLQSIAQEWKALLTDVSARQSEVQAGARAAFAAGAE